MTQAQDDDPPLNLARDGFFSVGGKKTTVNGKTYVTGQMYVEMRIPQKQTHPYPIVMVHGGTRSGTTFTGTPDGRESWAQYFARRGYAVYVVDQPGRARSSWQESLGPQKLADGESGQRRYLQQEKYKLWPQAHLHTQWPGTGEPDDPVTMQMVGSYVPELDDFARQQALSRDALVALLDKIGPAILLMHSQAAKSRQSGGGRGAERAAGAHCRIRRRADLVQGRQGCAELRHHVGAADLRSAGQGCVRAEMGEGGQAG
jgi:pimeloyl-ACP methyl ester carboxylesterase